MIRFIYADELHKFPVLKETMFRDRAAQFKHRLHWSVTLDENGYEVDQYDALNPLYTIWEDANGRHGGSMRTLPTIGRTMVNEHFLDLTGGVEIASPFIWECTRFCLAPGAAPGVAAGLLMAGCEMGLRFGLEQAIGVFDARMPRIYGRIGWKPDVIGSRGEAHDSISVGLWNISEQARAEISRRSGIPVSVVARWFDRSFDTTFHDQAVAA
ncbi:MAG TPA: acyl-homoserine-lactone synthase [Amaricoccus sp.]|uniref:acyl-homoserine-lactone synthase n=2 Tax=Amaricoccus sp. TaxID=1872485 RepID=UPI002B9A5D2B|nr:acyl-homoserine-lactone synthase [Amaricoccus sp.]HMR50879.1 acyl-homoserine-lactone synthase [Amaricoccus sp.]HMR60202.1 acyl-homoserine-lactone synthase [Amaricoccus sp.]HMT97942.1 acyl-homoserine-lactone synthase [Amaricoccus sp.]